MDDVEWLIDYVNTMRNEYTDQFDQVVALQSKNQKLVEALQAIESDAVHYRDIARQALKEVGEL